MFVRNHLHHLHASTGGVSGGRFPQTWSNLRPGTHLFGDGRELHDVEGLVIGGGALVDVDDHRRFAFAAEKSLEELGELALSEGDAVVLHSDDHRQRM